MKITGGPGRFAPPPIAKQDNTAVEKKVIPNPEPVGLPTNDSTELQTKTANKVVKVLEDILDTSSGGLIASATMAGTSVGAAGGGFAGAMLTRSKTGMAVGAAVGAVIGGSVSAAMSGDFVGKITDGRSAEKTKSVMTGGAITGATAGYILTRDWRGALAGAAFGAAASAVGSLAGKEEVAK